MWGLGHGANSLRGRDLRFDDCSHVEDCLGLIVANGKKERTVDNHAKRFRPRPPRHAPNDATYYSAGDDLGSFFIDCQQYDLQSAGQPSAFRILDSEGKR